MVKYKPLQKFWFYRARPLSCILVFFFLFNVTACQQAADQKSPSDSTNHPKIPGWLLVQADRALPEKGLNVWIPGSEFQASSLVRVPRFPGGAYQIDEVAENNQSLYLESVRNEQVSAQIAIAADTTNLTDVKVSVSGLSGADNSVIPPENIRVRFVEFVPVQESLTGAKIHRINAEGISGSRDPDVVGDPLIDRESIDIPMLHTQPVWLTFEIPEEAQPGSYHGTIEIQSNEFESFAFDLEFNIMDASIPAPVDYRFNLDMWMNPFAVADYHDIPAWSEEHWNKLKPYFDDLTRLGQKKILTTIVEKPWKVSWLHGEFREQTEAEFQSMIKWTLLSNGEWSFDYSIFDRYVEEALEAGNGPTIVAYSMLVFRGDQRITYFDEQKKEWIEESMDIMDSRYEDVWMVFLERFSFHLKEKGWFEQTHLGFDERPARLMNRAFSIIENAAPEFLDKIYISGGTVNLEVADLNIEITKFDEEGVQEGINTRVERDLPTRFYQTCCSGAHPNRFTFSPAVELQMIPWIALKYNFDGYVDWAYNSWPEDIYNYPVFNFTQGDEYYVYPGENGPVSSIRWELIKEGIEDFELAKILEETGALNSGQLLEAVEMATRNAYEGEKDSNDILKARLILLEALK